MSEKNQINEYLEDSDIQFTEIDELDFGGKTSEEQQVYVEQNFWEKLRADGKRIPFLKHVIALYHFMKDPSVGLAKKSLIIAGLLYFILPFDTVPDIAPLIGYLDDMGVIAALVKYLGSELDKYYNI